MQDNKGNKFHGFPMEKGVISGSVTRIIGGYLGKTVSGVGFIIGKENAVIDAFRKAGEECAQEILGQLEGVEDFQKEVFFSMVMDEDNAVIATELGGEENKLLMNLLNMLKSGKGSAFKEIVDVNSDKLGPVEYKAERRGPKHPNKEVEDDDALDGDKLEEIVDLTKSGEEFTIEKK